MQRSGDWRFASRQRFVFFTHRRRRCISIYKSYITERRQVATGRSGVGVEFTTRDRRFASHQRFVFFTHRRRRRVSIYKSYVAERRQVTTGRSGVVVRQLNSKPESGGSPPASALPFSHIDVGVSIHKSYIAEKNQQV